MNYYMSDVEEKIYGAIYSNSILFLRRAIIEMVKGVNAEEHLNMERAIVSTLFSQMTIELAMKAFLIRKTGIRTILTQKFTGKTDEEILEKFEKNQLHTNKYEELKNDLIKKNLLWFDEEHIRHLDQFQQFRNKLVHLNLFLTEADLIDLKEELIFVIVHILIPFLAEISFDSETPTDFYQRHLNGDDFKKLISYPPYVQEMEKLAIECHGRAYYCPECSKKAYVPDIDICYCCNLNYSGSVEYALCNNCKEETVIFDYLNIEFNDNIGRGLCIACDNRPNVYKCPICEMAATFYTINELTDCIPGKCILGK